MRKNTLNYIAFEFIQNCNLNCKYCYNIWKNPRIISDYKKTSYGRAIKVLRELYKYNHVAHMTFTGGEPFLFKRLEELVLFVRRKNTEVNVITNGFIYDEKRYLNLIKLGIRTFEFTLNHFKAEIHDDLCQKEGSFNSTVKAIQFLLKNKANVSVSIVLNQQNYKEIDKIIRFISDLGIRKLLLNRFNIGGQGILFKKELEMDNESLRTVFFLANKALCSLPIQAVSAINTPKCILKPEDYSAIYFTNCGSKISTKIITLDIEGNVRICNHSPQILGNLFKSRLDDVLNSDSACNWNSKVPVLCKDCAEFPTCHAGCRAASEQFYLNSDYADPVIEMKQM